MSHKDFSILFSSTNIGSLKLKNRLVMPPMVRNYATEDGMVTDRYFAHIERIAKGGVGMLVLEASYISSEGKGFKNQLGVHNDAVVPGLCRLVKVAHKHEAAIGVQLHHAGRQTSSETTGQRPVAPSSIPDPTINEAPHRLTQEEIKDIVEKYGKSAGRAKEAGCDFVEIHGAHGYLITQFLSEFSNKRKDRYGGSFENRMRFALEVVSSVREAVGDNFPVTIRLSADEMVPDGLTVRETKKIAKELEQVGIDALHVSAGNYASYAKGKMISPMAIEDGPLVSHAQEIKSTVNIPVITVGKIRTPEMASSILEKDQADFIAIGRTLLADPDWPNKVMEDRLDEINPCIACNQGCIGRLFAQQDVLCTVNPETSREELFAKKPEEKKKILIAGGGPAGMSAARTAAQRGHEVVLFEKENMLGGQLGAAGAAPHREGWNELLETLKRDIKRLGVDVRLGEELTIENAKRIKPDKVIVAIGSAAVIPNIPGVGRTQVTTSRAVLTNKAKATGDVLVAGGGCAGAQTAEYLAENGHNVTIVEMQESVALDAPTADRALLLERLKKLGVEFLTETKVMSIGEKHVIVEGVEGQKNINAQTVVICLGSFPNNGLAEELEEVVSDVEVVGDALEPRRVTEAMAEGALAVIKN